MPKQSLEQLLGSPEAQGQAQPQSLESLLGPAVAQPVSPMQYVANVGNYLQHAILNLGGGTAHGVLKDLAGLQNFIGEKIATPTSLRVGTLPSAVAPPAPFAQTSSPVYQIAEQMGQFAPAAAIAEEAVPAEALGAAAPAVTGAVTGFMGTPGGIGARTGGAAVGAAAGAIPEAAMSGIGYVRGLKNTSLNYLKSLLGDEIPETANSAIGQHIRNIHGDLSAESSAQYTDLKDALNNAGFTDDVTPSTIRGKLRGPQPKIIRPSTSYESLNQLLDDINVSRKTKGIINKFTKNPSYESAHNLQSELGDQGFKLKLTPTNSMAEKNTGFEMLKSRRQLINDMKTSIHAAGRRDLANQLQDISDFHYKNVIPYNSSNRLRAVINPELKGPTPEGLHKIFTSDDPRVTNILKHFKKLSPETNDLVLFGKLNKTTPEGGLVTSGHSGTLEFRDPKNLKELTQRANSLKAILEGRRINVPNLTTNLSHIVDNDSLNALNRIGQTYERKESLRKLATRGIIGGGLLGATQIPRGYEALKNLL